MYQTAAPWQQQKGAPDASSLARWGLHWQIAGTLGAEVNLHNYLQCTVSFLFTQAKLNSFWNSQSCLLTVPIGVKSWVHFPKSKAAFVSSPLTSQEARISGDTFSLHSF